MIAAIALTEILTETQRPHYMRGGDMPEIVFPPRMAKDMTQDWREEKMKLKKDRELNNGRLAMIGIASFLAEFFVPGSVPLLSAIDAF